MEKIKVLMIPADRRPYITHVSNKLKALQKIVNGNLEVVQLTGNTIMVVNEECILTGAKCNKIASAIFRQMLEGDYIFGDAFICGVDGEEFGDISEFVEKLIAPNARRYWDSLHGTEGTDDEG